MHLHFIARDVSVHHSTLDCKGNTEYIYTVGQITDTTYVFSIEHAALTSRLRNIRWRKRNGRLTMGKHKIRMLQTASGADIADQLERLNIERIWAEYMARKGEILPLRIESVRGKAASLLKQHMLAVGGECAVGRQVAAFDDTSAPVVLLGTTRHYKELLTRLPMQPFGLVRIGEEIAEALKHLTSTPEPMHCIGHTLSFAHHTLVMGIINTTPDSFSGDGLDASVSAAVKQAESFAEAGVDILDIGGLSTRPGSDEVSVDDEVRRVVEPIRAIAEAVDITISIDTYRPEVARAAIEVGAGMINDICALQQPGMIELAAATGAAVCLMHMQGKPRTMQSAPHYEDLITEVYGALADWIEAAVSGGVAETQIIIDPGFGFGKDVDHNLEIVRRLREFKSLGRPVLMGPSRKSTIGSVLGHEDPVDRVWGTAAVCAFSIANGADIIRVHDVEQMVQVARMSDAIMSGWTD